MHVKLTKIKINYLNTFLEILKNRPEIFFNSLKFNWQRAAKSYLNHFLYIILILSPVKILIAKSVQKQTYIVKKCAILRN